MGIQCCKSNTTLGDDNLQSLVESANKDYQAGNYQQALSKYTRIYDVIQAFPTVERDHLFPILLKQAEIYQKIHLNTEAILALNKVIQIEQLEETNFNPGYFLANLQLGKIYCFDEKYFKAYESLKQAFRLTDHLSTLDDDQFIQLQTYYGLSLAGIGRYSESNDFLYKAFQLQMKTHGETHPQTVMIYECMGKAQILTETNQHEAGIGMISGVGPGLQHMRKYFLEHMEDKSIHDNLVKAGDYYKRALRVQFRLFDKDSLEVARSKVKWAMIDINDESLRGLNEAKSVLVNKCGLHSLDVAETQLALAITRAINLDYDEARSMLVIPKANVAKELRDSSHIRVQLFYEVMGDIAMFQGRFREALENYEFQYQSCLKFFGEADFHVAEACESLGTCLIKLKRKPEAIQSYERALSIYKRLYGDNHIKTLKIKRAMDYWESQQWTTQKDEDLTDRMSKIGTSARTQLELSFHLDDFQKEAKIPNSRFVNSLEIREILFAGDMSPGGNKPCEDSYFFMPEMNRGAHFLTVIDGHGPDGKTVADDARDRFFSFMRKHAEIVMQLKNDALVEKFLALGMKNVEHSLQKNPKVSPDSGCCALAVLFLNNICYISNVGDCKAIIISVSNPDTDPKVFVRSISTQHRTIGKLATASSETQLSVSPKENLFTVRSGNRLLASRALGNFTGKQKQGMNSEPDFRVELLRPDDLFILAATDGLWDVMTEEEVGNFVWKQYRTVKKNGVLKEENVVHSLIAQAQRQWKLSSPGYFIGESSKQKSPADDIAVVLGKFCFKQEFKFLHFL